jgi:hypothetical protein
MRGEGRAVVLVAALGLGSSLGFFLWLVAGGAAGVGEIEPALRSYSGWLLAGLAIGGLLAGATAALAGPAWLARAGYASCLLYAGCFAGGAGRYLPWGLLVAAGAALAALRRTHCAGALRAILLLHAMGTLGGLYMRFQLPVFLAAWPAFREVLAGLRLLLGFA